MQILSVHFSQPISNIIAQFFLAVQDLVTHSPTQSHSESLLISAFSEHYNDNDYNDNNYRDSDLDLDWERLSDLVTQLTIIDKLRNLNHDIEG